MCRIAGIASLNIIPKRDEQLHAMMNAIAHGGPDDKGEYADDVVALGHRRLSIIDLSPAGRQPMCSTDSELIISFNGEIYNYQALKKELEALGAIFRTQTDTEVILQSYKYWGSGSFGRLEGIFAFSLYDKSKRKLLLVRDHVGVKPLYYFMGDKLLIFASEVRAFRAFNKNWKAYDDWKILFLAFGSIPLPFTTLDQVYQLHPGKCMELDLNDFTYTIQNLSVPVKNYSYPNLAEESEAIHVAVQQAVKKNLISDAPLGIFLSGGVDSSVLTLLADKFQDGTKTISINFDNASFDEYPFQKMVLEKTKSVDHTAHRVTERMFWDELDNFWSAMDQPTIDGVNTYFVSKCAHRDGLKAVLSGLGADEVFGGYASFKRIRLLKRLRSLPFKNSVAKIIGFHKHAYRRLMFLDMPQPVGDYLFLRGIHTPDVIGSILNLPENEIWDVLRLVQVEMPEKRLTDHEYVSFLESKIYLTNQLLKDTDCMGMWHGLEVRVPFLDIELLSRVESIKPSHRYKDGTHKFLLAESMRNIVPGAILGRQKKGFTFPMSVWMQNSPAKFEELAGKNRSTDGIVRGFKKGYDHWSKYWSLAVLNQFKH